VGKHGRCVEEVWNNFKNIILESIERFIPHKILRKNRTLNTTMVGKPEGKRPLGRPRRRWVDNIKMYLREIWWDGMDWIDLTQDRDRWRARVNTVMNLRVP
jgi:hypothetical protein